MGDLHPINSYYEQLYNENSPCQGIEHVSIIVNKKRWKKHKKHNVFNHAKQPTIAFRLSRLKKQGLVTSHSSMPELNKCTRLGQPRNRSRHGMDKPNNFKRSTFQTKFIANVVSEHRFDNFFLKPFNFPRQTKWKIYRCQLGSAEDSCCCSCNSDAMFEVMKGLYDCYKKKNCDDCDCILCSHLPQDERKLGEIRKSMADVTRENILDGKTKEEKAKVLQDMAKKGIPLPEGKTASDKALIAKTRQELGLPPAAKTDEEKAQMKKAALAGVLVPLEGKSPAEKEKILKAQAALGLPLPEGRTPSEKALIAKIAALPPSLKASGLLSPLKGKTPEQKENIVRGLAMRGVPLPEAKTPSEKKIIDKIRAELGLPPEPDTKAIRDKHAKAAKAGLLQPLEGKTPVEKEKILKGLHDLGIPLPEGRTPSEKALIAKVAATPRAPSLRTVSLMAPLTGKTPEQKEKILKSLAAKGMPLPEGQTPSEKKLIDKVRADMGLPLEPKSKSIRHKHEKAAKAGLLQPLEGKTPAEKEKILKGLHDMGIPLPEGRTPSEKALVAKVAASPRAPSIKTAGLMTPLTGKTPEQKENILKALAAKGMPLPEGQTPSEKKLVDKVRADMGLPPEPKSKSIRDRHDKAAKAGLLQPLEGKTPAEKEKILKGLHDMGVPLPEGRTASEKALVAKVAASPREPTDLLTPLKGKTPEEKEKVLRGLAMSGLPLPEGETPSEKKLINKVRADLGLPPEPKSKSIRDKHDKAAKAGVLQPLEGKTPAEKEKILKGLHDRGIPLPEGRTPSEKALIAKVAATPRAPSIKTAGLMTPLTGKTPEQKENILKALAAKGMPLPEGQTPSEKKLVDKVRADMGLPPEPKSKSIRDRHDKAAKAGLLQPLEGKTPAEKEKILKGLHDMGVPLPEGRTASEKALVAKVAARPREPPDLLTPLKGKSPEEKEKILRGLAASGLPLPEGETPSEKALIAKVAASPRRPSIKTAGLLTPLTGKTPEQKENILRGLAAKGMPLPEGQTPSEKKLVDKVRADMGLPPEPKSKSIRDRQDKAAKAGYLQPLEGKTPAEKEKILKGLHDMGVPLPEGRTASEKALVAKVAARPREPPDLLTPLKGKTPEEKEKLLRGLATSGLPLPEGETPSEKKLINKVRADIGLPPEPKSKSIRDKHDKAAKAGLLQPLEGKTPAEKEKILKGLHDMGISLPEGRTPSEKALVAKVAATSRRPSIKTAGVLTPLAGKTPEQKEKILRGLAAAGMPLPEGQTPSEKKLVDKVRADMGLPPEPKSKSIRDKHDKAAKAGYLQPLEGKTPAEKEKILKGLHDMGVPLPEGRTPSEKALVAKVAASPREPSIKTAGLLTPLTGKTPEQKEKILKGLAAKGMPLPEGQTPSEKKLVDKVRTDMGLPPEPKSKSIRDKYDKAAKAGLLQPLEGKTPAEKEKILKGLHDMGIPLPEGRTPSEKALVAKVAASPREPSIKTAGLLTPLTGKTPEQKEKILKGLAKRGLPLPEGQTPSEKKLVDKVRAETGLPPEPKSKSIRDKHQKAAKAGLLQPLEGKTPAEKERILKGLHDMGIPLPEGRTPSEKALIANVAASPRTPSIKTAGLMTPLTGKTPEQKVKILNGLAKRGLPLPEGQTPSEKKLVDKVRADMGLPPEPKSKSLRDRHDKAAKAGLLQPLEGKTPAEKEKILKGLHDMGIPLPEGRTPSEKALIASVAASPRAPSLKTVGLMTPLTGKTPEQREKILKGLAAKGMPLPEAQTPSEKKLIDKVRADMGLPVEPKSKSIRDKHVKAAKAGLLQPLEGKTPAEKEKILKGLHDMGIPLPEGRTPSEKALVAKVAASPREPSIKTAGLLTPLTGKTPEQKEKILKGLAKRGLPLPEGQTPSEKKLVDKVRAEIGLPPEPKSKSIRDKHDKAAKAGLLQPLEGKTPAEKERILKGLHDMGIPLPEGRTPSEKALIAGVAASPRTPSIKTAGLMTPLTGKTPEQKEKILNGLAKKGLPLPEGQTPSEKKLVDKVRAEIGLPPEPKSKSIRDKHDKAAKAGLLQPLEGKTPAEKERILKGLHDMGIPLPEGRTPSEKALIASVAASPRVPSIKTAGLMTPLTGKTPEQKEKILKALAAKGMSLPEGQTPSEKQLVDKVRADMGLPPEPKSKSIRDKYDKAAKAGLLQPLEGKTPVEKEKILKGLHDMGIPLPEGRTPSEKALIASVAARPRAPSLRTVSLMAPLTGKTPEQKEKILRGLAKKGLPLPEGETPSEKKLIDKVRGDMGLPVEPTSITIRDKHDKAAKAGLLKPLEGKTPAEKEKILKDLHDMGIPLPEGRTPSEKALIAKVAASPRIPSIKTAGLLTPLTGKTPEHKEKILKALAAKGMSLPEGQTPSEKKLIDKVRADMGLPPEPKSKSIRDKHDTAAKAGLLQPLEGKTPEEKEKILKGLHDLGIPLPEGRTPSEKALIAGIEGKPPISKSLPTITTEKMRKAKAAGLFTPLTGKTPEQKEKILRGLADTGLPLPEGKTPSEKALVDQIKKEMGITEKTPSEKLKKAKASGLLTPLEGKTPAEKEKILRGRAAAGLPLPIGKSPSERALIQKIKDDSGYVTPSPSERLRKAKAAGIITPLKGKTPSMKAKILRDMKAAGVPIPEGETPSETSLIRKIVTRPPSEKELEKTQSEKLRKAKAAGLLTPLEGKTPAQKEKILQGLADAGLPLPEGTTKSEKSMISKIKARTPPEAITPSEKSIIRKAKAEGLFTPITGKTPEQKEKILKGLADAGLPLPEGKTASEKALVKKIREEAGLPPEPTPSEKKGKIRKKRKKVGITPSKKAAGIEAEDIEEIIKTTTCDRACGCEKKKIKFKHSYVKIRVTSPDISSLCDCDYECIPGVKAGAFIDNEGIKVTVGSAIGIPSYSMESIKPVIPIEIPSNTNFNKTQTQTQTDYDNNFIDFKNSGCKVDSLDMGLNDIKKENYILNANSSNMSCGNRPRNLQSENIGVSSGILHCQARTSESDEIVTSLRGFQSLDYIHKKPTFEIKSASSFDTILIIKNDMSVSTSTSNSMDTISLLSFVDSSVTCSSAHYSGYQSTNDLLSINSLDGPSTSDDLISNLATIEERKIKRNIGAVIPQQYTILGMSQLELHFGNNKMTKIKENCETDDPIVLLKHLPSKLDVSKIMFKIMSKKRFSGASSIFIVVPTSDDDAEGSSNSASNTSNQLSECNSAANTTDHMDPDPALRTSSFTRHDVQVCGKGEKFYMEEVLSNDTEPTFENESLEILRRVEMTQNKCSQSSIPNEIAQLLEKAVQGVKTDFTQDRPCSSSLKELSINFSIQNSSEDHSDVDVISRLIKPLFLKDENISMFRINHATSSIPCSDPPSCARVNEQSQTEQYKGPCACPPETLHTAPTRTVKLQKPSVTSTATAERREGSRGSRFKREPLSSNGNGKVDRSSSPIKPTETAENCCKCPKKQKTESVEIHCECSKIEKAKAMESSKKLEVCCPCDQKASKETKKVCKCTVTEKTKSSKKESKATACGCSLSGDDGAIVTKKPSNQRKQKKDGKTGGGFWSSKRKKKSSLSCGSGANGLCCNRHCKNISLPTSCQCSASSVPNSRPETKMPCGCPSETTCPPVCREATSKRSVHIQSSSVEPASGNDKIAPTRDVASQSVPPRRNPSVLRYDQGSSPMSPADSRCPPCDPKPGKKSSGFGRFLSMLTTTSVACACPPDSGNDIKERSVIIPPDKATPVGGTVKEPSKKKGFTIAGSSWFQSLRVKRPSVKSRGTCPCYPQNIRSMSSGISRRSHRNQRIQTPGVAFSSHRSPTNRKASARSLISDRSLEYFWPRKWPIDDDVDKQVTKKRSVKLQKPSIQSLRAKRSSAHTKADAGWFRRLKASGTSSDLMVFDTLPCYLSSSQMQSHDSCSHRRCPQTPKIRKASAKVQKPSIESMATEGHSSPTLDVVYSSQSDKSCDKKSLSILTTQSAGSSVSDGHRDSTKSSTEICVCPPCTSYLKDAQCCLKGCLAVCGCSSQLLNETDKQSAKSTKQDKRVKSAKSGKSAKPAKSAKSAKSAKPGRSAKPAKPADSAESAKSAKSAKPAKPGKSAKPADSAESAESAKSTKPAKPGKSAKPAKPADSAESAESAESAKSAKSAKPAKPAKPGKSAKPAKPADSAELQKSSVGSAPNKDKTTSTAVPEKTGSEIKEKGKQKNTGNVACKCYDSKPETKEKPTSLVSPTSSTLEVACKCYNSKSKTKKGHKKVKPTKESKSHRNETDELLEPAIPIIETGDTCKYNKIDPCCECKQNKAINHETSKKAKVEDFSKSETQEVPMELTPTRETKKNKLHRSVTEELLDPDIPIIVTGDTCKYNKKDPCCECKQDKAIHPETSKKAKVEEDFSKSETKKVPMESTSTKKTIKSKSHRSKTEELLEPDIPITVTDDTCQYNKKDPCCVCKQDKAINPETRKKAKVEDFSKSEAKEVPMEPTPTKEIVGTKSQGIVTDLKGTEIQNLQRGKTEELSESKKANLQPGKREELSESKKTYLQPEKTEELSESKKANLQPGKREELSESKKTYLQPEKTEELSESKKVNMQPGKTKELSVSESKKANHMNLITDKPLIETGDICKHKKGDTCCDCKQDKPAIDNRSKKPTSHKSVSAKLIDNVHGHDVVYPERIDPAPNTKIDSNRTQAPVSPGIDKEPEKDTLETPSPLEDQQKSKKNSSKTSLNVEKQQALSNNKDSKTHEDLASAKTHKKAVGTDSITLKDLATTKIQKNAVGTDSAQQTKDNPDNSQLKQDSKAQGPQNTNGTRERYVYEKISSESNKNLILKLTKSISGIKLVKQKKINKPVDIGAHYAVDQTADHFEPETQLNFGEAIRYFANMNPELFQKLMQEEVQRQLESEMAKYKGKDGKILKKQLKMEKKEKEKQQKKAKKSAKKGKMNKETSTYEDQKHNEFLDMDGEIAFPEVPQSNFRRGFKLNKFVKGGHLAMAAVDCYLMSRKSLMYL